MRTHETALRQAARDSQSAEHFITKIQVNAIKDDNRELLDAVYDWSYSTPENQEKFKNTGWFGIATNYWAIAQIQTQQIEAMQP